MWKYCVRILLKKHLIDSHVQSGNHFLRITDELAVEIPIKSSQMGAVEIQEWIFQISNLLPMFIVLFEFSVLENKIMYLLKLLKVERFS